MLFHLSDWGYLPSFPRSALPLTRLLRRASSSPRNSGQQNVAPPIVRGPHDFQERSHALRTLPRRSDHPLCLRTTLQTVVVFSGQFQAVSSPVDAAQASAQLWSTPPPHQRLSSTLLPLLRPLLLFLSLSSRALKLRFSSFSLSLFLYLSSTPLLSAAPATNSCLETRANGIGHGCYCRRQWCVENSIVAMLLLAFLPLSQGSTRPWVTIRQIPHNTKRVS